MLFKQFFGLIFVDLHGRDTLKHLEAEIQIKSTTTS
jgi:hypothetical protein